MAGLPEADDGIVVGMHDPWLELGIPRSASYEEALRKTREILASTPQPPEPSDDDPPELRRLSWLFRESAARVAFQVAASRRERAERELRQREGASGYAVPRPELPVAREHSGLKGPPPDRVERRLAAIEAAMIAIREGMATKVELEALGDRIHAVMDGFRLLSDQMRVVNRRLEKLETSVGLLDLLVMALDQRVMSLDRRVMSLDQRIGAVEQRVMALEK